MKSSSFTTPKNTKQVEMLNGVFRRTMATTDDAMLCEITLLRDAVVPIHSHVNDQVGYLVSGKVEMTVGDEVRLCHAGDSYAIPGGVEHGACALEKSLMIDVFSPPRDDYRDDTTA